MNLTVGRLGSSWVYNAIKYKVTGKDKRFTYLNGENNSSLSVVVQTITFLKIELLNEYEERDLEINMTYQGIHKKSLVVNLLGTNS